MHAIFAAVLACLLAKFEFQFKLEVGSEVVELGVRTEYLPYIAKYPGQARYLIS
jgi:hypothetical protein